MYKYDYVWFPQLDSKAQREMTILTLNPSQSLVHHVLI